MSADDLFAAVPDIVSFGGKATCPTCGASVGNVRGTAGVSFITRCGCGLVLEATTPMNGSSPSRYGFHDGCRLRDEVLHPALAALSGEPTPCVCGEPESPGVHRLDGPCH